LHIAYFVALTGFFLYNSAMSKRKKPKQPDRNPSPLSRIMPWLPAIVILQILAGLYWVSRDTAVSPLHLVWTIIALASGYLLLWHITDNHTYAALALPTLGLTQVVWSGAATGSASIFVLLGAALLLWALLQALQWATLDSYRRAALLVAGMVGGLLLTSYGQAGPPPLSTASLGPASSLYDQLTQQFPLWVYGLGLAGLIWLIWQRRWDGLLVVGGTAVSLAILYVAAPMPSSSLIIPLLLATLVGVVNLLKHIATINPTALALGWGILLTISLWLFRINYEAFL
jgi:hypothetical protein